MNPPLYPHRWPEGCGLEAQDAGTGVWAEFSSFLSSPWLRDDCRGGAGAPLAAEGSGGGEALFIIQPAEITPSSFSRGQNVQY